MAKVFAQPLTLTLVFLIVVFGGSFLVGAFLHSPYALPLASGWAVATFSLYVSYASFLRTTALATKRREHARADGPFLIALAIASAAVLVGATVPALGVEMPAGLSNLLSFLGYAASVTVLWTAASDLCWGKTGDARHFRRPIF